MSKRKATSGSFKPGKSGNPTGKRKARNDSFGAFLQRVDGWQNDLTGFGISGRDKLMGSAANTMFSSDVVDSESALELWRGDDIAARYVELVPDEALRQGFEVVIGEDSPPSTFTPPDQATTSPLGKGMMTMPHGDADDVDDDDLPRVVTKKLRDLGLQGALREAMCYRRAYGGGAILIGANDFATDLREPLDISKVRSVDWLTPLEPRELIPRYYYNDPRAPKFGQPAIYQLAPWFVGPSPDANSMNPQVYFVHESRLVVFPGVKVSRRLITTSTFGWGDSVFTRIIRALRDYNYAHTAVALLIMEFGLGKYKVKGLAELISQDNPNAFLQKLISIDTAKSVLRSIVVDADGEDFERTTTTMAGLSEAIDRVDLRLAAAAGWPLTKLTGMSARGLNATGEGDDNNWDDMIRAVQELEVKPAIEQVVGIVLASLGEDPDEIDHQVKFPPLSQPSDKDIAAAHFQQAQADQIYLNLDVVSPEEIARSRFGGGQYSFETKIDFGAREQMQSAVAPTVEAKPAAPVGVNEAVVIEASPMPEAASKPTGVTPAQEPPG